MIRSLKIGACLVTMISGSLMTGSACRTTSDHTDDRADAAQVIEPGIEWHPLSYVVYRVSDAIAVDGKLDDTGWLAAQWTSEFVDIEGATMPTPRFRTRAKMLWDTTYFYIGAEMEEPHVWATLEARDAVIYHDNDFEVFVDPDGDTHEYYELEINAFGTVWDLFLVKPYRDGGPALNAWDIQGLQSAVSVDGTLNNPFDTDRGWYVELAIPWDVLGEAAHKDAPPIPGDHWRVNFSRVEWRAVIENGGYVKIEEPAEGRSRPEDNWVWSPQGLIAMHYPEMWGFVQFSEQTVGSGVEAFVSDGEDEARWFLRQVYYKEREWHSRHGEFTSNVTALAMPASPFELEIVAAARSFDAWVVVGGSQIHIAHDGRVW